jgi:hypothetical protein
VSPLVVDAGLERNSLRPARLLPASANAGRRSKLALVALDSRTHGCGSVAAPSIGWPYLFVNLYFLGTALLRGLLLFVWVFVLEGHGGRLLFDKAQ